jgi:hypothetical protein
MLYLVKKTKQKCFFLFTFSGILKEHKIKVHVFVIAKINKIPASKGVVRKKFSLALFPTYHGMNVKVKFSLYLLHVIYLSLEAIHSFNVVLFFLEL